jgi:hypothetical protein
MAVKHGSIGEFDNTEEAWETYTERVDLYLIVNEITDAANKQAMWGKDVPHDQAERCQLR